MLRKLLIAAFFLLFSCGRDEPSTSLPEYVESVVDDAWYELGNLPDISNKGDHCKHMDEMDVFVPKDLKSYVSWCRVEKSWGCQLWLMRKGVIGTYYPAIVLNRKLQAGLWPNLMVHEMIHAYAYCRAKSNGSPLLNASPEHLDPLLWTRPDSMMMSVEERAQAELAAPSLDVAENEAPPSEPKPANVGAVVMEIVVHTY